MPWSALVTRYAGQPLSSSRVTLKPRSSFSCALQLSNAASVWPGSAFAHVVPQAINAPASAPRASHLVHDLICLRLSPSGLCLDVTQGKAERDAPRGSL
ncbi:MAG: hypothetical protein IAI49_10265 [Candidatus Eremiobacteraeota bacterium]|nr:hypothetical protein [Candidatus Eremiobacteraeota bacterium]